MTILEEEKIYNYCSVFSAQFVDWYYSEYESSSLLLNNEDLLYVHIKNR